MANARLLVKRLKSVRNIRKITRTMELIATSRFKKAMDRATEAAAYTKKISEIVGDLGQADLSFSHPLLEKRSETKKSVLLVLTSNRGLCGGYNGAVLRNTVKHLQQLKNDEIISKTARHLQKLTNSALGSSMITLPVELIVSMFPTPPFSLFHDRQQSSNQSCHCPAWLEMAIQMILQSGQQITNSSLLRRRFWKRLCPLRFAPNSLSAFLTQQ
jgi:hypothetical protein